MKEIKLTQNKIAIVDDEDYEKINQRKWYYCRGYALRNKWLAKYTHVIWRMHWEIMGKPRKGFEIDHKDGNKLNNQKSNLRICSHKENGMNRKVQNNNKSGYKGVHIHKLTGKWRAMISINNKSMHLGLFNNKEKAVKAYNDAAKKYYGEFAKLNVIHQAK